MIRIELNPMPDDRWKGADLAIHTDPSSQAVQARDVRTFCSELSPERANPLLALPRWLEPALLDFASVDDGTRAMVGNAGSELTFRHLYGRNARRNILTMLRWATWAYKLIGERLVLAPMDMDLIHDAMSGRRLLDWAAAHSVPLVIFCGYRLLFRDDEFAHIHQVAAQYPFDQAGNPFVYPYTEVSDAIKDSHAEVWTGVGFEEGLRAGAMGRAEQFGFCGVLTSKAAWIAADY